MNSRQPWIVFGVGVCAYVIAVMQRTSIGVAGVAGAERFHVSAALLSTLAVVQLIVYAGLQIPVGVVIDRIGPRVLLLVGTALMGSGQLVVGISDHIAGAIGGRVLVGAGDAMIFTSVLRLISSWFPSKRVPQLSQLLGNFGQGGQILSAIPFALILHESGWTLAFVSAASASAVILVSVFLAIKDRPEGADSALRPVGWRDSWRGFKASLAQPGTRLGFWSHFVSQSSGTVFTLMWGVPFMVFGLGLQPALASGLLIVCGVAAVISGPFLGYLTYRFPLRRSDVVLGIVVMMGVAWSVVLLWPGVPPLWMLVVLLVAIGIGGPGSLIGLDFARTSNPVRSLGSANGIVNSGGFLASFIMMYLIGVVLDLYSAGSSAPSLYTLDSFRVAFLVQYIVVGLGVFFLIRSRRRTREKLRSDQGIIVGPLWVRLAERWRRG